MGAEGGPSTGSGRTESESARAVGGVGLSGLLASQERRGVGLRKGVCMVGLPELRPYQSAIYWAARGSVVRRRGLTMTVEIARQGGKNEISAQLGIWLLAYFCGKGGRMVKAAPTFNPQALVSLRRLQDRLDDGGFAGKWRLEGGNIVRLERSQQTFLSAEPTSNVVGATADVLLELDEAQDVERDKFLKEFRPMGATGNATTVLYGTPWDGGSLLETMSEENRELERRDGVRRDFRFDWEAVAACSPLYGRYVESERDRLGEEHPLFRTQYRLLPIAPGEGMFNRGQLALLRGGHARLRGPLPGRVYVAGVDVAGEPWGASGSSSTEEAMRRAQGERSLGGEYGGYGDDPLRVPSGQASTSSGRTVGGEYGADPLRVPSGQASTGSWRTDLRGATVVGGYGPAQTGGRDATVVTIGEVEGGGRLDAPSVRVVEHYRWTGEPHHALTPSLVELLRRTWRCRRVVVDATGLGTGVASGLVKAMGGAVEPFVFTSGSKSRLGFELLGAVNTGRVSAYAGDGSSEYAEFWREMELAQARYRVNQTMDFFVEASRGHDDYLMSLALMVRAAASPARTARGRVGETPPS